MISRSFCVLFVFVFIDSAFCEKDSNKLRRGISAETTYPYNHPPSVENYNPIPVAIVYDTNDYSRKAKTKHIIEPTDIDEEVENKETALIAKENVTTTEKIEVIQPSTNPSITSQNQTKLKLEAKFRALDNFQIPVAVVYDNDPNNFQYYQKPKTETKTESPKVRSSYARKKQIPDETERTMHETIIKNEKLQQNSNPKTFQKRTEGPDPIVPIIDMESYVFSHNGNFRYSYEGGDGTKAFSEGKQIIVDEGAGEAVVGGFSYKDKDGKDFSLTYTADEKGYRPVGDHLPTPPPIPPAIARALAYLATATPETITKTPEKSKPFP